MRHTRFVAPVVVTVAFSIILAACGQVRANPDTVETPVPTPIASPTDEPTPKPTPKPAPSEEPAEPAATPTPQPVATPKPQPAPIEVVEHRLPMVGRSVADKVNVRERPDLDASVFRWDNGDEEFEVRLSAGQTVAVIAGPLFADGESWYQIQSADDRYPSFGTAWVAGRFLERVGDLDHLAHGGSFTGLGTNGSIAREVTAWTPLTVEFAAAPMPGAVSCAIDIKVTDTQGRTAKVASFTAHNSVVGTVTSPEVAELYQDVAGVVTVHVTTDCSSHVVLMAYPF